MQNAAVGLDDPASGGADAAADHFIHRVLLVPIIIPDPQ
jgi:hypothetical protein